MSEPVKCVVWDLDNTLWRGILVEGDDLVLDEAAARTVRELDRRGIVNSVASRNDPVQALEQLERLDLLEYFVAPQIGWGAKSASVAAVASELGIGLGAVAFVDDDPFELDEVRTAHPEVRCYRAGEVPTLLDRPELVPSVVTEEGAGRRALYQAEERRRADEAAAARGPAAFLAGLGLVMHVWRATPADLDRASELTVRTHQLNTTGRSYDRAELEQLARRDDHLVLLARLEDRYGSYGTIGLTVVALEPGQWTIELLLMSCRVMSRGAGGLFLGEVQAMAARAGVRLRAGFVPNDRNRPMLVTLRFAGFDVVAPSPEGLVLEAARPRPPVAHARVVGIDV